MPFLDATGPLINVTSFNVLTVLASYLGLILSVFYFRKKIKKDMETENNEKFGSKADLKYVDQQDRGLHHRINKIEKDQDSTMKKMIDMSEDIAWIRGFLDPNKKK